MPSVLISDSVDKVIMKCEYCGYKNIMLISEFVKVTAKAQKNNQKCPHKMNEKKYCFTCGIWFCLMCDKHQKKNNHYLMDSSGFYINEFSSCECFDYVQAQFYCNKCKKQFCSSCKENHLFHDVITLKSILDSQQHRTYQKIIVDLQKYIKYRTDLKNNAIDLLKKKIQNIEKVYEESHQRNQSLFQLLQILLNAYNPNTPNYYSAMNIIYNFDVEAKKYDQPMEDFNSLISFFKHTNIVKTLSERKVDVSSVKISKTEIYHDYWVGDIIILQDGRLASCSGDTLIKIYNMKTCSIELTLEGHTEGVRYLSQMKNGQLLSCSIDCMIKIWDIRKPKDQCIATLVGHTYHIRKVMPISNGRLASCGQDGTLKIWESVSPYSCLKTIKENNDCINVIELEKKNSLVTVVSNSMNYMPADEFSMIFYDSKTFEKTYTINDVKCCSKNALVEYNNKIIAGGVGTITIINYDTYQIESIIKTRVGPNPYVCSFVNIGKDKIIFGVGGRIGLLDLVTKEIEGYSKIHKKIIYKLLKIGNEEYASASDDRYISYWNFPKFNTNYIFTDSYLPHTIDNWFEEDNTSIINEDDYDEDDIDQLYALRNQFFFGFIRRDRHEI